MKSALLKLVFAAAMFSLLSIGNSMSAIGCEKGSGNIVKEDRQAKRFSKVVLKSSGNVYIKQGSNTSIQVETDDNIQKLIRTEVEGASLVIYSEESICPRKLNFYLIMPDIESLNIKGSGNIGVKGPVNADRLELKIDGSGDIKIKDLNATAMRVLINGSGDIEANGEVASVSCSIKGSGDIDLQETKAKNFEVSIYGSGDVSIEVDENLDASIYGSGDVIYTGNPSNIRKKVLGSGSVIKR